MTPIPAAGYADMVAEGTRRDQLALVYRRHLTRYLSKGVQRLRHALLANLL